MPPQGGGGGGPLFVWKEKEIQTSTQKIQTIPETKAIISQIPQNFVFRETLKFGQRSLNVKYLQIFLKSQGPEIYPEGLVTGYFGPKTFLAVKRFQQKYWEEILKPLGLTKEQATGFVGKMTIKKINEILNQIRGDLTSFFEKLKFKL